jgi:hypothetical protein
LSSLYLYFFKQYKNTWKNLVLRIRIEIFILFIIYFSFFATRLIKLFNDQLSNFNSTPFGLSQFLLHGLILLISFSVPFIHLNLLPKQKSLVYYRTLPLNKTNTFWLLFFLHFKYQIVAFIVMLPVFIALLATVGIVHSFYFFVSLLFYQTIMILFISELAVSSNRKHWILLKYFFSILLIFTIYFLLYFLTEYYFAFDPIFLICAIIVLTHRYKNLWINWDNYIGITGLDTIKQKIKTKWLIYSDFYKLPLGKIKPIFAKEFLNYLRNRKFIRLQIISIIIFLSILFVLHLNVQNNFVLYSSFITILFIWQHFTLQFNEKYIKADSAFFMKALPFKYHQLWIAKFINEFIFVFTVILFLMIFYFIKGFVISEILQSLLMVLIFSLIVLATIINFKIIFFDRPRFAGYAYHFFIVFIAVMSYNYYLVGPIIALILLTYFTYYSYREFAR